jgi:hypothetical protein
MAPRGNHAAVLTTVWAETRPRNRKKDHDAHHRIWRERAQPRRPWKVTADDGAEFHAATELEAAERLADWIAARQARDDGLPLSLPPGGVLL